MPPGYPVDIEGGVRKPSTTERSDVKYSLSYVKEAFQIFNSLSILFLLAILNSLA